MLLDVPGHFFPTSSSIIAKQSFEKKIISESGSHSVGKTEWLGDSEQDWRILLLLAFSKQCTDLEIMIF